MLLRLGAVTALGWRTLVCGDRVRTGVRVFEPRVADERGVTMRTLSRLLLAGVRADSLAVLVLRPGVRTVRVLRSGTVMARCGATVRCGAMLRTPVPPPSRRTGVRD